VSTRSFFLFGGLFGGNDAGDLGPDGVDIGRGWRFRAGLVLFGEFLT